MDVFPYLCNKWNLCFLVNLSNLNLSFVNAGMEQKHSHLGPRDKGEKRDFQQSINVLTGYWSRWEEFVHTGLVGNTGAGSARRSQ